VTHNIDFRPGARADLFDLYQYIEMEAGLDRAGDYIARIENARMRLCDFPSRGTPRNDIGPGVRTIAFERHVLIVFRILDNVVEILRLLYAGRDFKPESILPEN
jgi:toxin ParE1/3/4